MSSREDVKAVEYKVKEGEWMDVWGVSMGM
jgi:hypothetical protein